MVITPKNSPYILGIDLGTSNSAIAIFIKGKADVLPVDGGKKMCPSVVSFRKGDTSVEVSVGHNARKRLITDPHNTIASIKREMGTDTSHEFPNHPGKKYTPIDISAEILLKLAADAVQDAERLRGTPRYTVICIPANFTDTQKIATKEAAKLANLDALYLLEEPVAAAIAYGMEKERDQTILVYDLGGGTFDVCVLKVKSSQAGESKYEILAKAGISQLGGDDFDYEIMKLAAAKLQEMSGIDLLLDPKQKNQGVSAAKLRSAKQQLKEAAEAAKCELSEAHSAQISIPDLLKDESGKVHNLELEITRQQFEDAIKPLILQSKDAVQQALDAAKLSASELDRIILIGGSTRIPLVRTMLQEMLGQEPYADTDPDTAVARGAAIFGANLGVPTDQLDETSPVNSEDQFTGSVNIDNIVTHFLGIEIAGGGFSCLLEKDQKIPADAPLTAAKEYSTQRDDMTELMIRVYQAPILPRSVRDEGVECIGEFFLTGILPKPKGQERVSVQFAVDSQNLLTVKAKSSGSSNELAIERS